jgi:hypothetical protein
MTRFWNNLHQAYFRKASCPLSVDFERTWWRLFQKRVMPTKCRSWAYLMKAIPETRHAHYMSILSIPDECYSWTCHAHQMSILSIPDEGYSRNASCPISVDFERTWWRLFQKRVIPTKCRSWAYLMNAIHERVMPTKCRFWAYLMKVIPETRHAH